MGFSWKVTAVVVENTCRRLVVSWGAYHVEQECSEGMFGSGCLFPFLPRRFRMSSRSL